MTKAADMQCIHGMRRILHAVFDRSADCINAFSEGVSKKKKINERSQVTA